MQNSGLCISDSQPLIDGSGHEMKGSLAHHITTIAVVMTTQSVVTMPKLQSGRKEVDWLADKSMHSVSTKASEAVNWTVSAAEVSGSECC